MTELDLMVNTAYAVLLISFLMRDILWLRVLTVAAIFIETPYFYFQPETLWPPIAWNVAFFAINAYWIARLSIERRPVHFSPEEQRLYDTALRSLKPRHARALFEAAAWKTIQPGEQIVTEGQPLNTLSLVAAGKFTIEKDGSIVDEIGEGRFIGSYSFLKNNKDPSVPVTIIASKESRLLVWQNDRLRGLIHGDTQLSIAVEASLGLELAQLLDHARDDLEFALRIDHIAKQEVRRESARHILGSVRAAALS